MTENEAWIENLWTVPTLAAVMSGWSLLDASVRAADRNPAPGQTCTIWGAFHG